MIDMVMDEKNRASFITDIEFDDKVLKITRADGSVSTETFSYHNLGFYRTKMVENAELNINPFMDDLSKDSFFTFVKRYAAIIGGIVGLYFLYNVDIHLIIKIILTILVVLGEAAYYLFNQLYLMVLSDLVSESLATEFYLKNINKFTYFDRDNYTDGYIVPPEDIGKYRLTQGTLEQILKEIECFKEQGLEPDGMSLTYKRKTETPKNML